MSNLLSETGRDGRFVVVDERYWKSAQKKSSRSFNGAYFASNSSSSSFSSSSSSLSSSESSGRSSKSFTKRCSSLIKQQRARFYIMRRCVVLLLCWHGDS